MVHPRLALIGRRDELDQLADLLAPERGGSASLRRHLLLAGDAGVGKTRLLQEFRTAAIERGWNVVAGHCLDFGDSALPYLPFTEVLDRLSVTHPEVVDTILQVHPALSRLRAAGRHDPGSIDRGQIVAGVHALLDAVAAAGPTVVVIEDVHWADQSSRDLITLLLTRPFTSDLVLVASYRSDDLHRRHPLRRQVAEWSRLGGVERLTLGPLPDDEVRTLVHELSHEVGDADREDIVARAEGNAFFVEELVGAATGPGHWMPDELADVLLVRLDRLGDEARSVVRTASVAGRRVRHGLLAQVVDLPAARLDEALRQAVESHVLVAGTGDYWFRHALLAEAVYEDLLPGERVSLHGRFATALAADLDDGDGSAAELARHARQAHDLDTALIASITAGAEAMAVGAPEEASQHYERALTLIPGRILPPEVRPALVVESCVLALTAAGRAERGAALAREQVERLSPETTPADRSRVLAAAALALGVLDNARLDPIAYSREAVELAPEDDPALRARVLANHARILGWVHRFDEAEEAGLAALALAELHGLAATASAAVAALTSLRKTGDPSELRIAARGSIARAQAAGALEAELQGWFLLARSYEDYGLWGDAEEAFLAGIERAVAAGQPWAPYAVEPRHQLSWVYYVQGRWAEALELTAVARPGAPPVGYASLDAIRQMVRQGQGQRVPRRLHRDTWNTDGVVAVFTAATEIVEAGIAGDHADAVAVYDDAVATLTRVWDSDFSARLRLGAVTVGVLADALGGLRAAERPAVLAEAERIAAEAGAVVARLGGRPDWGPEGRAWTARLRAELLRAHWRAGDEVSAGVLVEAWQATVEAYDVMGHRFETASTLAVLATLLRATGDVAQARTVAERARVIAVELGASRLLAQLGSVAAAPPARGATPAGPALTPREIETLQLVAAGRTNGEIAKALFISTKTVSVHVSNILAKLGAGGRTEAAAIARRDGLITDS
ncbi:helix-turn-helix transcriptional regulator [Nocardioides sp.]|uniref:helix-turn-helix transcriptional regulator n=1 Tax=Nocardioides sp. TaxID=35761 RepID=UPI0026060645|nr:helix-turn-helix transcriptional regulator [Nocardioides sp.]